MSTHNKCFYYVDTPSYLLLRDKVHFSTKKVLIFFFICPNILYLLVHIRSMSERSLEVPQEGVSATIYVFMEKEEIYQYICLKKSTLSRTMLG